MTARSTVMIYTGPLSTVNGVNDPYAASNLIQLADDVVLQVPFGVTNGTQIMTDETANFFEAVQFANRPVWVAIDLLTNYTSAVNARNGAISQMAVYYSWFQQYRMLPLLKGFYFYHFGFDESFSDTVQVTLTRQIQNDLITNAHIKYNLPVFVNCKFPSDALTEVGPVRGTEDRAPLIRSILGFNPLIQDAILIRDPLYVSWASGTPTTDKSRIGDVLALVKKFQRRNLAWLAVQRFDLSTSSADQELGLTVNAGVQTHMNNYAVFMRALGIGSIGGAALDWGRTSQLAIDPSYFNNNGLIDNVDGLSVLYSRSGNYYVTNDDRVVPNPDVPDTSIFNNLFAFTSGVIPAGGTAFQGPTGATGVTGPAGDQGPVGPPGSSETPIERFIATATPLVIALDANSYTLVSDCTANYIHYVVPAGVSAIGKIYKFLKADASANVVQITVAGGGLINGSAVINLTSQFQKIEIQADPLGNWYITG